MSLHVDTDALQNQTLPALNKSKENLSSAREIISSIDIPSDFRYASTIRKIINDMENTEKTTDKFYNYVNEKISRLSNAEKSNTNVVDNILKIDFNNEFDLVGAVEATGAVVKDKGEELLNNTINFINYVCSPDFLPDLENSIKETGTEIKENVKNFIQVSIETGAQIGTYVLNKFKENFPIAYNVGCKIVEGVKWLFSNVVVPLFKFAVRTATTVVNMAISLVEGLVKLVGSIFDAVFIVGGGIVSILGLVIDLAYWIYVKLTGNDDGYRPCAAKEIMEATMSIVAEQPVENAFRSFYENNVIGKNLDKYAFGPFKNAGTGSKIVQGIGEISGIVVLTIATMGIFGAVAGGGAAAGTAGSAAATSTTVSSTTATIGAVIKATSAFGKYTGQRWAEFRDASWEGIERLHNNGEMSDDMYYSYITVRCLSEDEWKSIENDWIDGKITEEQYTQMKQIRDLPEEWTTKENCLNGLTYGTANGIWEGLQFYLGGKLASWGGIEGSKIATSAIRVGVDTTFNAADTPFRALVDSATSNKSIKQAWQEQGGWASVFVDTGIGLVGSIGGEVFDYVRANKLNKDKITDDISSKSYDYSNKRYNKYDMAEQYIDYRSQQGDVYFFYKGDDDIAYFYPYSKDHLNALENGKSLKKYASEGYMNVKNYLIQMGLTNQEASQMIEYNLLNKQDINTRLEFSKIYMKNGLKGYISPGKIDDTFEKIKIYDTREEFEKAYHGPHPETIMGFNRRGTMNLPPEVSTSTIIHEANHSLGDLRGKMNLTDEYRGTNEAFTEEIARKLSRGDFHSRGYQSMTDALELVNNKLNEKGYGNLDLQAYFTGSAKGLKEYYKAVDSVGGKGFCDEFFKALNDVHDTVFSKTRQVVGSKANLNALVQYFISR